MRDVWITDWTPSIRWPHYTRANAGEVLPTPASPLGQTFSWENGMCQGWRDGYVRVGSFSLDEFSTVRPEATGFFGGYFYINLSNVRMQGVRSPFVTVEQLDLAFFGDHPEIPPYTAHPLDDRPDLVPKIEAHFGWITSAITFPEADDEKAASIAFRAGRPDLTTRTDAELVARARSTQAPLAKLFETHTVTSSSSGVAPGILFAVGEAIGDPTVPMKLVAGIGDVDSAEPSYRLWELSRQVRVSAELTAAFDAGIAGLLDRLRASSNSDGQSFLEAWASFIFEFGSRGPNEWEMSADSWETDPRVALSALDRIRFQHDHEAPSIRNAAKAAERSGLIAEVRAKAATVGPELAGSLEAALVATNQLALRERTKTNLVRYVNEGRVVFRELARRHSAAGNLHDPRHFMMLLDNELDAFVTDAAAFTDVLAERYAEWLELWDLEPPFFIVDGVVPPISSWPRKRDVSAKRAVAGDVLQGVPGCPGVVRGRARIVADPASAGELEPGDILIAPLTDPSWTPLFMAAGGVVVNVGGQISHAIIVSRELGLPCVVSVEGATKRIPDGAQIEVDGSTGRVTVLSVPG